MTSASKRKSAVTLPLRCWCSPSSLRVAKAGRGWFIGGEDFRKWLTKQLPEKGDNLRGSQRRAHDESEAERLLELALAKLELSEEEFLALRFNRAEKQAVVWLLKRYTTVTGVWLADRLKMGSRANLSRALKVMSLETNAEHRVLKQKMTQCAG